MRRSAKGCTRACCVVQRKPDSDEEDEPPPAKQQRTTTAAPAASSSSSALTTAPPPTGDTSRSEVLLGDRIMVGQTVKLKFPADHQGAGLNGTLGRTVAYEAASEERPYGRFEVELVRNAAGAVLEAVSGIAGGAGGVRRPGSLDLGAGLRGRHIPMYWHLTSVSP